MNLAGHVVRAGWGEPGRQGVPLKTGDDVRAGGMIKESWQRDCTLTSGWISGTVAGMLFSGSRTR